MEEDYDSSTSSETFDATTRTSSTFITEVAANNSQKKVLPSNIQFVGFNDDGELSSSHLPLGVTPLSVIRRVISQKKLRRENVPRKFAKLLEAKPVQELCLQTFWYVILEYYQKSAERDRAADLERLFCLISKNYLQLFLSSGLTTSNVLMGTSIYNVMKNDKMFEQFPDILSQITFDALNVLFTEDDLDGVKQLKKFITGTISYWFTGLKQPHGKTRTASTLGNAMADNTPRALQRAKEETVKELQKNFAGTVSDELEKMRLQYQLKDILRTIDLQRDTAPPVESGNSETELKSVRNMDHEAPTSIPLEPKELELSLFAHSPLIGHYIKTSFHGKQYYKLRQHKTIKLSKLNDSSISQDRRYYRNKSSTVVNDCKTLINESRMEAGQLASELRQEREKQTAYEAALMEKKKSMKPSQDKSAIQAQEKINSLFFEAALEKDRDASDRIEKFRMCLLFFHQHFHLLNENMVNYYMARALQFRKRIFELQQEMDVHRRYDVEFGRMDIARIDVQYASLIKDCEDDDGERKQKRWNSHLKVNEQDERKNNFIIKRNTLRKIMGGIEDVNHTISSKPTSANTERVLSSDTGSVESFPEKELLSAVKTDTLALFLEAEETRRGDMVREEMKRPEDYGFHFGTFNEDYELSPNVVPPILVTESGVSDVSDAAADAIQLALARRRSRAPLPQQTGSQNKVGSQSTATALQITQPVPSFQIVQPPQQYPPQVIINYDDHRQSIVSSHYDDDAESRNSTPAPNVADMIKWRQKQRSFKLSHRLSEDQEFVRNFSLSSTHNNMMPQLNFSKVDLKSQQESLSARTSIRQDVITLPNLPHTARHTEEYERFIEDIVPQLLKGQKVRKASNALLSNINNSNNLIQKISNKHRQPRVSPSSRPSRLKMEPVVPVRPPIVPNPRHRREISEDPVFTVDVGDGEHVKFD